MSGGRKGCTKGGSVAPQTLALLRFVRQHQPVCTWDAFSVYEGAGESLAKFSHRLQNLRGAGWLSNDGSRHRGLWSTTAPANSLLANAPRPLTVSPDNADDFDAPRPIVPPRQVDVMGADEYRPAPVAYRAGAFDHTVCPSRMGSRSVPFWAGGQGGAA